MRRIVTVALALLVIASTTAVAAQSLTVSVTAPAQAEIGNSTDIDATVSAGERFRGEQQVNVTLLVNGSEVDQRTVQLQRNESETRTFTHKFTSVGEKNVTIVASYSTGTSTVQNKSSTTVQVINSTSVGENRTLFQCYVKENWSEDGMEECADKYNIGKLNATLHWVQAQWKEPPESPEDLRYIDLPSLLS